MNKILPMTLLAGALSLGLAGCNEPINALQDQLPTNQFAMANIDVQHDVRIKPMPPQRVGAGQLEVIVQVYNLRAWDYVLDYTYYFVDANGAQVESPSGRQELRIPPHGTAQFKITSMTAQAADFRIQMRKVD